MKSSLGVESAWDSICRFRNSQALQIKHSFFTMTSQVHPDSRLSPDTTVLLLELQLLDDSLPGQIFHAGIVSPPRDWAVQI
jgi:hypothetical protein